MKKLGITALVVLLILALAVHFILFPFLLMIALGALGFKFNFWICLVFWIVATGIGNHFRPKQSK